MKKNKKIKLEEKKKSNKSSHHNMNISEIDKMIFNSVEWKRDIKEALTKIIKDELSNSGKAIENDSLDKQVDLFIKEFKNSGCEKILSKIGSCIDRQKEIEEAFGEMSKNIIDDIGIKVEYDSLNKMSEKQDITLAAMENMESILINELNKCFKDREKTVNEMSDNFYDRRLKGIMTKEQFQDIIKTKHNPKSKH